MKNKRPYRSYSENMKILKAQRQKQVTNDQIQMILDKAILAYKRGLLETKINDALDSKNKTLFLELAAQYAKLKDLEPDDISKFSSD
ncbi:IDEAL domain-containing protein [Scopulibacillus darangshiensis]|uniref:IDEAL domain-containing protein n=1 Tax=Scopulibacillus darangshiensis TaxID=442528 RepID=A0A4R2P1N7_9BACL|nr:IDEAL domain-containing protein [Scopulibacillus darangshiensis]TCP27781.1 IDEAL domain-containing protein [Scopulibacillus darangshiensis]